MYFLSIFVCACVLDERVGASANCHISSLRWQKSDSKGACREIESCLLNASETVLLLHVDMELFILLSSVIHNITAFTDFTVPSNCRWDISPSKRWTRTWNPWTQIWCLYILFYICTCCWHGHGAVKCI